MRTRVEMLTIVLLERQRTFAIVCASVVGGIGAAWFVPHLISWVPYDYLVLVGKIR